MDYLTFLISLVLLYWLCDDHPTYPVLALRRRVNKVASSIHLNCWVEGDYSEHVFPVKIDGTETVGTLKEVIREKKKRDTDSLELFKVRERSNFMYSLSTDQGP
jgi:hypothetical protein